MESKLVRYLIMIGLAGLVVALDQVTKLIVVSTMTLGQPQSVIGDFFQLKYVTNTGVAFGLKIGSLGWNRVIFSLVNGVAIIVIAVVVWKLTPRQKVHLATLSVILGGAVGNLIDRLRQGMVIDFLDFGVGAWRWPTFNVADMAITGGGIVLIYLLIRGR